MHNVRGSEAAGEARAIRARHAKTREAQILVPSSSFLFFLLRSVLAAVSSRCIFLSISFYRIHPSAKVHVSDFHQILLNAASEKPCNLNAICDLRDLRVIVDFIPSYVFYVT